MSITPDYPKGTATLERMIFWLAVIASICSATVFARRSLMAWSVAGIAPGVAVTSGFEAESLFALYRNAHQQPVYLDPAKIPYASAYFNWLYYVAYTGPMKRVISRYGAVTIPRMARVLSATGSVAGVIFLWVFGRWLLPGRWLITIPVATWIFLGPLVGWWAHTARPDVWALACEVAAIAVLLRYFRARPTAAVLAALVLFYAAWAFKPTYVLGLGTAVAFLSLRRRFGSVAILAGGSLVLWAATFWLLGPAYQTAMLGTAVTNKFYLAVGWGNFSNVVEKIAPLLVLTVGLWTRPGHRALPETAASAADTILFGKLGVLLATPIAFGASCKLGAAANYFFTPLLMLALLTLGLAARRPITIWLAIFLSLAAVMQILVLSGQAGRIDLQPQADALAARWSAWKHQPEPRFSADLRLNLPWLNPHSPPFVLAFNYEIDRAAGRKFEGGGVGGLISSGFFAALLLPAGELSSYDGGDLRLYRKARTDAGMSVYLRRPPPSSNP